MFTDTDVEANDSTWGLYEHRELADSRREKKSYLVPGTEEPGRVWFFEIRHSTNWVVYDTV